MKTLDKITIGKISKITKVSPELLRHYESKGLIPKSNRTPSNYRIFTEDTLSTLLFIREFRVFGFSLEEIKSIIGHKKNGFSGLKEILEILDKKHKEISKQVSSLKKYQKRLSEIIANLSKRKNAKDCPIVRYLLAP